MARKNDDVQRLEQDLNETRLELDARQEALLQAMSATHVKEVEHEENDEEDEKAEYSK